MRMSNEAFEAEVRRRAAAYQQTERARRKRILMTAGSLAACLVLAVGFGLSRSGWKTSGNMTTMDAAQKSNQANSTRTANAPSEYAADVAANEALPQTEYQTPAADMPGTVSVLPPAAEDQNGHRNSDNPSGENLSVHNSGSNTEEVQKDAAASAAGTIRVTMDAQTVPADTEELKITLTNPGDDTVMIDTEEFRLIYSDADGKETVMFPRPEAPGTRFSLTAGRSATLPVRVTEFADGLTAGVYRLEFRGESVMFTVE